MAEKIHRRVWNGTKGRYEDVYYDVPVDKKQQAEQRAKERAQRVATYVEMHARGMTDAEIGKQFGITSQAVNRSRLQYEKDLQQLKNQEEAKEGGSEKPKDTKFRLVKRMLETLKIRDKAAQIVWFVPNYAQRCLDALVVICWYLGVAAVFNILKSRQEGYSTRIEGYCYTWTKEFPNEDTLLAAHAKDNTLVVLDITKRYHHEDPEQSACGGKFNRDRLEYPIAHGSKIRIVTAETEDSGASATTRKIHNSEFGLFTRAAGYWGTLFPSWPATPGSFIFNETTGRPEAMFFKSLFDAGFRHDPKRPIKTFQYLRDCCYKGIPAYISIFDSWIYHKEDEIPLSPGESVDDWDLDERELALMEEFPILKEQPAKLKWFHQKYIGMNRDWSRMMTEYPLKPEHPFQFYGGPAYDQVILDRLLEGSKTKTPLFRGEIDFDPDCAFGKPKLTPNPFGHLLIFETPLPDYLYSIGGDFAQGTGSGDYNEIVVVRVPKPGEKRKVVAHWRTNERGVGPAMAAVEMWLIAKYYGRYGNIPLLIPERPAINQVAIEILMTGHSHFPLMTAPYPLIYSYKQFDSDTGKEREEYGFQTTQPAKEKSIDALATEIAADMYEIESEILVQQLKGFAEDPMKKGKGRWVQRFIDPNTNKPNDDAESAFRMANVGVNWMLENDIPVLERVG